VLVLRVVVGFTKKYLAALTSRPIGRVWAALARPRQRLQRTLTQANPAGNQEASREL
jgi:hypothetical protein